MKKLIYSCITSLAFIAVLTSCSDSTEDFRRRGTTPPVVTPPVTTLPADPLGSLPADVGGIQKAYVLGATISPYGYYLYTPSAYTPTGAKYPLLIFLHGSGEIGNSKTDPKQLDKILVNGPPKLIKGKTWNPKYPMVVASIQCHEGWWDVAKVKQFTEYMMKTYQIDTTRIYMTGLSMGGYGTWDQMTKYGKACHLTAAVPISGGGVVTALRAKNASNFPIWAFHGEADKTVLPDYDIQIRPAINALKPAVPAKLSMYAGVGHDAWSRTYNSTGKGTADPAYDPFNMDIYTWMFQYVKKK